MPPTRPDDGYNIPVIVSPNRRLGYIKVHKCGSNTWGIHFRQRLQWDRAWAPGCRVPNGSKRNQAPTNQLTNVLFVVRDPVERYLSAVGTVSGGFRYDAGRCQEIVLHNLYRNDLYTADLNQHFWPYTWYLHEWPHLLDRLDAVDISHVQQWLIDHNIPLPPADEAHRNPTSDKDKIREHVLNSHTLDKIHEFYADDYRFLEEHGFAYT